MAGMAFPRLRRSLALLASVALVLPLAACFGGEKPDGPLKAFLAAWEQNKLATVGMVTPEGPSITGDAAQKLLTQLEGDLAARRPKLTVKGKVTSKDDTASATVGVAWPIVDTVTWEYDTTVRMIRKDDKWLAVFGPKTIHPDLASSDKMVIRRTAAERGAILDGAGQPVVSNRPVVVVGVEPRQIVDINTVVRNLGDAFKLAGADVDLSTLPTRVQQAKPDAFVEIVTLRQEAYDKGLPKFQSTVGLVTRKTNQSLAPTATFARALLGRTGEVTKEQMDKTPGKYRIGDIVGQSGLQQRYDDQMRGTPGITVAIPAGQQGQPDKKLFTTDPKPGVTLKTTLDVRVQNAAEGALAPLTQRSSLVAIRVSDGALLAAADGPTGAQLNLAMTAQVPPGSTFKTITALAVLENGSVALDTPINCPQNLTVDGRTFRNSGNMQLGTVPFRVNFYRSCNTAFASLAPKLGGDGLANTGKSVGIGVPWDLGAEVYTGKVSANGSPSERAAAAFGQGTTLVSPITLAGAAAAVARGQWKQPRFVTEPVPTKPAADGPTLKPEAIAALKTMMREVVTAGTAQSLAGIPDLHGKTGTAEFDTTNPALTHSWFMGFKGDIAFCVFVENGGSSTAAAVPAAGRFFTALG
jgi:cell division protein FtsI/penicillin-binding protein 2